MNPELSYLVAVDYSDPSSAALQEAGRLAAHAGAHLTVVHVVLDEELAFTSHQTGLSSAEILTGRRLRLDRFCLDTLGTRTVPSLRLEVVAGHPFAEITRLIDNENITLLVLGARGESHPEPGSLGTVAASCTRHAPCETLLVRSSQTLGFKRIVTAVDFSDLSRRAIRRAVEIARSDDSDLHLLHVYAPAWKNSALRRGEVHVEPDEEAAYLTRIQSQLSEFMMDELPDLLGRAAHIRIRESFSRASGIVSYLQETDADLVVLGGKPHRPSDCGNLGVTAETMIHDAPCSVLTLQPERTPLHLRD